MEGQDDVFVYENIYNSGEKRKRKPRGAHLLRDIIYPNERTDRRPAEGWDRGAHVIKKEKKRKKNPAQGRKKVPQVDGRTDVNENVNGDNGIHCTNIMRIWFNLETRFLVGNEIAFDCAHGNSRRRRENQLHNLRSQEILLRSYARIK